MSDFYSSDLSRFSEAIESVSAVVSAPNFPAYDSSLFLARLKAYFLAVSLGEFPHTSLGCYPRFGILSDGQPICPDCCRTEVSSIMVADFHDGWLLVGDCVNYEDSDLLCYHCGEKIPSAYGDDEAA